MRISLTSNVDAVLGEVRRLHPQWKFAAALALTRAAAATRAELPAVVEAVLDRPTPFTRAAFAFTPARKDRLEASVYIRPIQAEYLRYQVEGGTRRPKRIALRLPAVVDLTEHGNLPAGLIRALVARARAGKRATKSQARRFGVSSAADLFYGDPGQGRPAGIYKRVPAGAGRERLVPVVVFPRRSAVYQARFDFYAEAGFRFEPAFPAELERAWADANKG